MIAFIRGTLFEKGRDYVVVETGGIGYAVNVSAQTLASVGATGDSVLLHTYMKVSDDGVSLYGFLSRDELTMFNYLIGVGGIGPKGALGVLSQFSPDSVVMAVLSEDAQSLSKAPGIGKKTAGRIILDLKDKFKADNLVPAGISPQQTFEMTGNAVNEAIDALIALGYSQSESTRAVLSVSEDGLNSSQLIKLALKRMAQS